MKLPSKQGKGTFKKGFAFKTSFAMKLSSKQGLLSMRGFQSETQTNKHQTKLLQFKNKQFMFMLPAVETGCHGQSQQY